MADRHSQGTRSSYLAGFTSSDSRLQALYTPWVWRQTELPPNMAYFSLMMEFTQNMNTSDVKYSFPLVHPSLLPFAFPQCQCTAWGLPCIVLRSTDLMATPVTLITERIALWGPACFGSKLSPGH